MKLLGLYHIFRFIRPDFQQLADRFLANTILLVTGGSAYHTFRPVFALIMQ
jgi:hypothetical protein